MDGQIVHTRFTAPTSVWEPLLVKLSKVLVKVEQVMDLLTN